MLCGFKGTKELFNCPPFVGYFSGEVSIITNFIHTERWITVHNDSWWAKSGLSTCEARVVPVIEVPHALPRGSCTPSIPIVHIKTSKSAAVVKLALLIYPPPQSQRRFFHYDLLACRHQFVLPGKKVDAAREPAASRYIRIPIDTSCACHPSMAAAYNVCGGALAHCCMLSIARRIRRDDLSRLPARGGHNERPRRDIIDRCDCSCLAHSLDGMEANRGRFYWVRRSRERYSATTQSSGG